MAMTRTDVEIDCGRAYDRAADLGREADEIRAVAKAFQSELKRLDGLWSGQSAKLFQQRGSERAARLNRAADNLDEIAAAIRKTADVYKKQQLAAIKERERQEKSKAGGGS